MIFNLSTSGRLYSKESKSRLEKLGFVFSESTSFHDRWIFEESGQVTIELKTLEELIEFSKEFDLIISPGKIEIYDDYRE